MNPQSLSLPADYHTHTRLCKHAEGEPLDYVRAARQRGIPQIAVTDHGPTPLNYDTAHRMDMTQFAEYLGWVEKAQCENGLILLGIEADFFEGCEPFLGPWLAASPFDLVLGSIHYVDSFPPDRAPKQALWDYADIPALWKRYFELITSLANSGLYDVVTHLDMLKRNGVRPRDRQLHEWACPALDAIAQAGMALEINTAGLRHPAREIYPCPLILDWARERGIPIVFGSDAHSPGQVGSGFDQAVAVALETGYREVTRFNRRSADRIPLKMPAGSGGSGVLQTPPP